MSPTSTSPARHAPTIPVSPRHPRLPLTGDRRPLPLSPRGPRRGAVAIALVLTAQLMLVLDMTVVNVALPRIGTDLGFDPASLSWVLNAYSLAFGGLLVLGGRLGDALGRLSTFRGGLTIFTIASVAGAFAQSPEMLLAARALQGVGAALAAPSTLALLTTSATDEPGRLRALALFGAVSSGGFSLGLILGGVLTDLGSWRWTLLINLPIGLFVLALVGRYAENTARQPGRFDVLGAVLATSGAVAVVWSLIGAPEHGWTSARTLVGLAVGALALASLALVERRVAHPLISPALVRSRSRVGALAAMAFVVGGNLSTFFLVVQYVQGVLGFGPLQSGLAFLPMSVLVFAMSRVSPRIVGLIGPARALMIGGAGLGAAYLWLSTLTTSSTYVGGLLGPFLLMGFSMGMSFMPITALALAGVAPEEAGSASGLLQTTQQLGSAVGIAVVVSVYAAHAVPGQIVPGLSTAFHTSLVFASLVLLVATGLHLASRRTAPKAEPCPEEPCADEAELVPAA